MNDLTQTTVTLRGTTSSVQGVLVLLEALARASREGGFDFVRVMVNARDGFRFSVQAPEAKDAHPTPGLHLRRAKDEHGTPTLYLELV